MLKNKFSRMTCIIFIVALLIVSNLYAYATEYWGSFTSYSAGDYSAKHASYMDVILDSISARTKIQSESGSSLPPGTMGVYPRGYFTDGTLAKAGSWSYTSISAVGFDCPVHLDDFSEYLYSKGMSALWNGDGYTTKSTTSSPNAKKNLSSSPIMSIQVNTSGQTFGSAANSTSIEDEPDLILAEGIGGVRGYVKSSDLNGEMPKSPEEAVKMMQTKNSNQSKFIPLYDSEGKAVIGQFKITPPDKNDIETINK